MSDLHETLSENEIVKQRFIDIVDSHAYSEGGRTLDVKRQGRWALADPVIFLEVDGIEFKFVEETAEAGGGKYHIIEFCNGENIVYMLLLDEDGFSEVLGDSDMEVLESNGAPLRVMRAVEYYEQRGYMTMPTDVQRP